MADDNVCACGEPAAFECADCHRRACREHFCAGCGRCPDHCACAYRFWMSFPY